MGAISASMVKELREKTGAGMMECKKALEKTEGDIEAAIETLRKEGLAKAVKKAGRIASEGVLVVITSSDNKKAVIVEVNCETDFVARDENLRVFAEQVAQCALSKNITDPDAIGNEVIEATGESIESARKALVAKLGENIQLRRIAIIESDGQVFTYKHGDRIAVMLALDQSDETLGRDIAMHIAASRPTSISPDEVSSEIIEKEKEIFAALAQSSGKPADIVEKMIEGRIKKFLNEVSLIGQPFVKDPNQSVGQLLKSANANVTAFIRFELGEGIEKKQENFQDEVMAQVREKSDD